MQLWAVFLLLAIFFLIAGLLLPRSKEDFQQQTPQPDPNKVETSVFSETGLSMTKNLTLVDWDEAAISRQLDGLRGQSPAVISHYIESVKQRMVINQNDKTAAARARFLKTKLEELKLIKEGRQVIVDLEALALEREKRLKTLELEVQEIDNRKQHLSARQQLEAMREQKKLELEIAQLNKQIKDLDSPAKAEPQLTPQQQREQRHQASEARLQKLKAMKQEALQLQEPGERIPKVNAIDDAIQEEMKEWARTL